MSRMGDMMIHVAVAAVFNQSRQVLVTLRPPGVDQGGLWEFPGGKVEPGEDVRRALMRELEEEVGIQIGAARPLLRVRHRYPATSVLLDVWRVTEYSGQPCGREGQRLSWRAPDALDPEEFPAADRPIITAVRLPALYLVTPEPGDSHPAFLARLMRLLDAGIGLVQFRAKTLKRSEFVALASEVIALCRTRGVRVLLNSTPELSSALGADGVHLSSDELMRLSDRPLPWDKIVAASCHDRRQVGHAERIGVDFVVLSPVLPTASHPGISPLGWQEFHALVDASAVPAYALGGLGPEDLPVAWQHGAQGVAAIRALWEAEDLEPIAHASRS